MTDASYPREHRSFPRWRNPTITLSVGARTFRTVDWSLGGVLVGDVGDGAWKCGQMVDVRVGVSATALRDDRMIVVRYDADQKRLAIRARPQGTVLDAVRRDCEAAGLAPA